MKDEISPILNMNPVKNIEGSSWLCGDLSCNFGCLISSASVQ